MPENDTTLTLEQALGLHNVKHPNAQLVDITEELEQDISDHLHQRLLLRLPWMANRLAETAEQPTREALAQFLAGGAVEIVQSVYGLSHEDAYHASHGPASPESALFARRVARALRLLQRVVLTGACSRQAKKPTVFRRPIDQAVFVPLDAAIVARMKVLLAKHDAAYALPGLENVHPSKTRPARPQYRAAWVALNIAALLPILKRMPDEGLDDVEAKGFDPFTGGRVFDRNYHLLLRLVEKGCSRRGEWVFPEDLLPEGTG